MSTHKSRLSKRVRLATVLGAVSATALTTLVVGPAQAADQTSQDCPSVAAVTFEDR
jgi:hypothetical protein